MKLLAVLLIAVAIFVLVYLSSDRNTIKAVKCAICAALAAALAFSGPYIINWVENREPNTEATQENTNTDETVPENTDVDESADDSNVQDSSGSEDDVNQPTYTEDQTSEEKPTPEEKVPSEEKPAPTSDPGLSIEKIATVGMEVQSIESRTVENVGAQIDVYGGSLTMEGQVDTYSFTPSVTGRYRFEISGLTEGTDHKVNLEIKNAGDGIVDSTRYGVANGDGLTVKDLQAGETFQVQVKQYNGLDSYTLSMGNQKGALDVTGYTVVKDSVEFKDQRNVYIFTPPITGRYRFEISDLTKGSDHKVNLSVYNSGGGEEASTSYGVANGDGLTIASMQAEQTYEIRVRQYSGVDSYNLNIGYQCAQTRV